MSWASRRRFQYLALLIIFIGIVAFAIAFPVIFKKPTCTDNKKNGDETGIDCGGSCLLICKKEIYAPVVVWSRAFPVVGSIYNLVAYVENRNRDAGVETAAYQFKIYDENNKLINIREGQTFIPPNQQFAVFESRFDAGQSNIKTVTFEFELPLDWINKEPTLQTLPISVSNIVLDNNKDTPSLSAIVNNESIYDLPEFDVVAVLYDINHNAVNVSRTYKDKLSSNDKTPVFFTWPETLLSKPVNQDVLVQINPFSVSF